MVTTANPLAWEIVALCMSIVLKGIWERVSLL